VSVSWPLAVAVLVVRPLPLAVSLSAVGAKHFQCERPVLDTVREGQRAAFDRDRCTLSNDCAVLPGGISSCFPQKLPCVFAGRFAACPQFPADSCGFGPTGGGWRCCFHKIQGVVSDRPNLDAAFLMGLGGGLRAFAPAAALAVHGRGPLAGRLRFIAFGAAALELIADKQPGMPSRWAVRGMSGRLVFSATGGGVLGGGAGAELAVAAAVGSAFAGSRLREKVHGRRRQLVAAVAEDLLSYSLVLIATSSLN
jgi:uncharacterized membrane protein